MNTRDATPGIQTNADAGRRIADALSVSVDKIRASECPPSLPVIEAREASPGGLAAEDAGCLVPVDVVLSGPSVSAEPLRLTVTLHNRSRREISYIGFGPRTTWLGEIARIDLVEVTRGDDPVSLLVSRPLVTPPAHVAGMSRTVVPPGESISLALDARQWTIRDGWAPGCYRVQARLSGIELDERTMATITSAPLAFMIRGE